MACGRPAIRTARHVSAPARALWVGRGGGWGVWRARLERSGGAQVRKLKRLITLEELKALRGKEARLSDMQLFTTARLSIQNVTQEQWDCILELEETGGE